MAVIAFACVFGFVPLILALAEAPETPPAERFISFRLFFYDRTRFPQTIRQSSIEFLLGPEYQLVAGGESRASRWRSADSDPNDFRDRRIYADGGVITLRTPEHARRRAVADKLELMSRIKMVRIY
jgi:hypothetical protein